jgi:hypothetical protein
MYNKREFIIKKSVQNIIKKSPVKLQGFSYNKLIIELRS